MNLQRTLLVKSSTICRKLAFGKTWSILLVLLAVTAPPLLANCNDFLNYKDNPNLKNMQAALAPSLNSCWNNNPDSEKKLDLARNIAKNLNDAYEKLPDLNELAIEILHLEELSTKLTAYATEHPDQKWKEISNFLFLKIIENIKSLPVGKANNLEELVAELTLIASGEFLKTESQKDTDIHRIAQQYWPKHSTDFTELAERTWEKTKQSKESDIWKEQYTFWNQTLKLDSNELTGIIQQQIEKLDTLYQGDTKELIQALSNDLESEHLFIYFHNPNLTELIDKIIDLHKKQDKSREPLTAILGRELFTTANIPTAPSNLKKLREGLEPTQWKATQKILAAQLDKTPITLRNKLTKTYFSIASTLDLWPLQWLAYIALILGLIAIAYQQRSKFMNEHNNLNQEKTAIDDPTQQEPGQTRMQYLAPETPEDAETQKLRAKIENLSPEERAMVIEGLGKQLQTILGKIQEERNQVISRQAEMETRLTKNLSGKISALETKIEALQKEIRQSPKTLTSALSEKIQSLPSVPTHQIDTIQTKTGQLQEQITKLKEELDRLPIEIARENLRNELTIAEIGNEELLQRTKSPEEKELYDDCLKLRTALEGTPLKENLAHRIQPLEELDETLRILRFIPLITGRKHKFPGPEQELKAITKHYQGLLKLRDPKQAGQMTTFSTQHWVKTSFLEFADEFFRCYLDSETNQTSPQAKEMVLKILKAGEVLWDEIIPGKTRFNPDEQAAVDFESRSNLDDGVILDTFKHGFRTLDGTILQQPQVVVNRL